MDKDDFQAWKDSPATQWVLARLRAIAERVDTGIKDRLTGSYALDPALWACLQSDAANAAGYLRAMRQFIDLEYEEIEENDVSSE